MTIDEFVAIRYGTPVRRETDLQQMWFFTCLRTRRRQTEGALDDDGVVRRGAEV